jgi:hypothetical protein
MSGSLNKWSKCAALKGGRLAYLYEACFLFIKRNAPARASDKAASLNLAARG